MVRRGFDLSGDLRIDHDPPYETVFALRNLLIFSVLVIAALAYRHRPEIHKRLMLFANIELMPAPLALAEKSSHRRSSGILFLP
jgi:hypothetical protein